MNEPGRMVDEDAIDADESLARLSEILKDIVQFAEQNSAQRCPYKNIESLCTAGFRCRNQVRTESEPASYRCSGDHKLAWLEPMGERNDQHAEDTGSD